MAVLIVWKVKPLRLFKQPPRPLFEAKKGCIGRSPVSI